MPSTERGICNRTGINRTLPNGSESCICTSSSDISGRVQTFVQGCILKQLVYFSKKNWMRDNKNWKKEQTPQIKEIGLWSYCSSYTEEL